MNAFTYLLLAIATEIVGTTALKLSDGFTKLIPALFVVVGYGAAFYFLSLALKDMPLGIAYAIWSAIGTVGTVIIGVIVWGQPLSKQSIFAIALIVIGVVLLNYFNQEAHA